MNTVPLVERIAYHTREAEIETRLAGKHKRNTYEWTRHMQEYRRHCDEACKLRSEIREVRAR